MSKKNKDKSDKSEDQEQTKTTDKLDESVDQIDTKNLDEPTREELEEKVVQLNDDVKRAQADFINLKRRSEQQRTAQTTQIKVDIVRNILPVLDSLERAVEHKPDTLSDNSWAQGVDTIAKQLLSVLSQYGVEKIETLDQEFDPNLHEAVSMDDSTKGKKEVVVEEMQPGYKIGDTVVRHAMVVVGKK